MTTAFWLILGLGLAIPGTIVLIINMVLSLVAANNYSLDIKRVALVYFVTLLGYAITFGIRM
ncbi:hypothetical protein D1872_50760 [compost metagenome]